MMRRRKTERKRWQEVEGKYREWTQGTDRERR